MKTTHKIKIAVRALTYVQIRFDLYKVFNSENKHIGFANGIGGELFY